MIITIHSVHYTLLQQYEQVKPFLPFTQSEKYLILPQPVQKCLTCRLYRTYNEARACGGKVPNIWTTEAVHLFILCPLWRRRRLF